MFGSSKLNATTYDVGAMGAADFLYDFGTDYLTCTMKMEIQRSACQPGWNALGFKVASWNVANVSDATYWFEFLQQPSAPSISSSHASGAAKATSKALKLVLDGRAGTVAYQYRVKGAKKWASGKTASDMFALRKLKAATGAPSRSGRAARISGGRSRTRCAPLPTRSSRTTSWVRASGARRRAPS